MPLIVAGAMADDAIVDADDNEDEVIVCDFLFAVAAISSISVAFVCTDVATDNAARAFVDIDIDIDVASNGVIVVAP